MFWKFNSFIGTLGLLLIIATFLHGDHAYSVLGRDSSDHIVALVWAARTRQTMWLAYAGSFCLLWQGAMTTIGVLTSFFSFTIDKTYD